MSPPVFLLFPALSFAVTVTVRWPNASKLAIPAPETVLLEASVAPSRALLSLEIVRKILEIGISSGAGVSSI